MTYVIGLLSVFVCGKPNHASRFRTSTALLKAIPVLHDHGGRERNHYDPQQEYGLDPEQRAVVSADVAEDAVMGDPVGSFDPEADQERLEHRQHDLRTRAQRRALADRITLSPLPCL